MTSAPAARAKRALGKVLATLPMRAQTGSYCYVQTIGFRGAGINCDISVPAVLDTSLTNVTDKGEFEATNAAIAAASAAVMAISPNEIWVV